MMLILFAQLHFTNKVILHNFSTTWYHLVSLKSTSFWLSAGSVFWWSIIIQNHYTIKMCTILHITFKLCYIFIVYNYYLYSPTDTLVMLWFPTPVVHLWKRRANVLWRRTCAETFFFILLISIILAWLDQR